MVGNCTALEVPELATCYPPFNLHFSEECRVLLLHISKDALAWAAGYLTSWDLAAWLSSSSMQKGCGPHEMQSQLLSNCWWCCSSATSPPGKQRSYPWRLGSTTLPALMVLSLLSCFLGASPWQKHSPVLLLKLRYYAIRNASIITTKGRL